MHDRRRWVLGAWLLALVGFGMVSGAVGDGFRSSFDLPNVESKQGFDVLDENFGGQGSGISGSIVDLGLPNMLQMFGSSAPQGTLVVEREGEQGWIAFADNQFVAAEVGARASCS